MKKTIVVIGALVGVALMFGGCDRNKTTYVEVGEPLLVDENKTLACGESITVMSVYGEDGNITVGEESFSNEFGVDFNYTFSGEACPEPVETEREPEDGVCDEGWEFANDCATVCTPIVEVCLVESLCGEGTYLDENNTCQIDDRPDEGECGEGTELVDGVCTIID